MMEGPNTNNYISATRKSFISNDNDGNMIEKNFIEIEETFLLKICDNAFKGIDGENVFEHINSAASEWFTTECIGTIATWDELVERFTQKFHNLFDHDDEEEADDNEGPDEINDEQIKGSWGDVTPGIMKFCTWLRDSFENFYKLEYDVLVKLEECWWKVNTNEICPYTRWDNRLQGPYANTKPNGTFNRYLDTDRMPEKNYDANNMRNVQEGQGYMENLAYETLACKIRKFEMMKYTFEVDEEYVAIKELINHSKTNEDARYAYRELFHKIDDGWLVTRATE
ncbi:hypothetical protein Tco_0732005 [Tanacetum coccineum]